MSARDSLDPSALVRKGLVTWVAAVAYMAILAGISLRHPVSVLGDAPHAVARLAYNGAHIPAYALLALLWCVALRRRRSPYVGYLPVYVGALSITVGFGAAMEAAQVYVPGRTGSILDGFLNGVGAVVGTALAAALVLKRDHLRTPGEQRLAGELREMLRKQVSAQTSGTRLKQVPSEGVAEHP